MRHAAACGRISSLGYHLKGTETRSVAMPRARSCEDQLSDEQLGAAAHERHLGFADDGGFNGNHAA